MVPCGYSREKQGEAAAGGVSRDAGRRQGW